MGAVSKEMNWHFLKKRKKYYYDDDDELEDIIKIPTNIVLYDKDGNVIDVLSIPPAKPLKDVFAW